MNPVPENYGNPRSEYEAAQTGAALFDLSDRTQIELAGGDRVKFLHNFCTNDVNRLRPGEGCEAFVTNVKGRILGHIFVFLAPESIWIDTIPSAEQSLLEHFDRYIITDDVELRGRTDDYAELLVSGPQANAELTKRGLDVGALGRCEHTLIGLPEVSVAVRRVDWLGQPGYLLSVLRNRLSDLWNRLVESDLPPAGRTVFEALRIEAGLPWYGIDISEQNIAQEAGRTGRAISFTKGCYLGQEPIARLDAMGHTNRELRGLRLSAGPPPEPGSAVLSADDRQEIGRITSAALVPTTNLPVALALLRSGFLEPGTAVHVASAAGATTPATVFWPG